MSKLEGALSIHRSQGPNGAKVVIAIEDVKSGTQFVRLEVDAEEFGNAVTGLAHQLCEIELWKLENVGKIREQKKVLVDQPGYDKDEIEEAKKRLSAEYEVDGWVARMEGITNSHHWVGDNKVSMLLERYVNPE